MLDLHKEGDYRINLTKETILQKLISIKSQK
jgi:hypothetical protein